MASRQTNRERFKKLAITRVEEAEALYQAKHYSGAYYLAGYAVECALKAVICKQFQRHTLPGKQLVNEIYQHDLVKLLKLSGFAELFESARENDSKLEDNWLTIKDWNESTRYTRNKKSRARDLINAVCEGPDSFLEWVKPLW